MSFIAFQPILLLMSISYSEYSSAQRSIIDSRLCAQHYLSDTVRCNCVRH